MKNLIIGLFLVVIGASFVLLTFYGLILDWPDGVGDGVKLFVGNISILIALAGSWFISGWKFRDPYRRI